MMLATHQMQSSNVALPSRSLPWGRKLEKFILLPQVVPSAKGFTAPKHCFPLRLTINYAQKFKPKRLCICYFKGNPQNEESSSNGSSKSKQHPKNSSRISYVPQSSNLPELQDVSVSGSTNPDEGTLSRSQAIQKLFRHWLTLLWTESAEQVGLQIEAGPSHELSQSQKATLEGRSPVLKVAWRYFMALDVTVKIPLMIFVPLYLAVNLVCGGRVAREMTPLWIMGPLIAALYVKLAQRIIALYVITSKQTVQVCKNLPLYMVKLGKGAYHSVWIPLVTTDYKGLPSRKWKEFLKWRNERWIDFLESIWPWYYRWLQFAKHF